VEHSQPTREETPAHRCIDNELQSFLTSFLWKSKKDVPLPLSYGEDLLTIFPPFVSWCRLPSWDGAVASQANQIEQPLCLFLCDSSCLDKAAFRIAESPQCVVTIGPEPIIHVDKRVALDAIAVRATQ